MFGWCNGWCDLLMVNGEKGSKEIQPSQDEHVTTGDQKSLGINENPNAFGSVAATNKNSWVVRGLLVHWFLIGREGGTIWNEWGIYRSEATPGVSKHILVRKEFIVTFFLKSMFLGWLMFASIFGVLLTFQRNDNFMGTTDRFSISCQSLQFRLMEQPKDFLNLP